MADPSTENPSPSISRRDIVQEILRLEIPIEEDWDSIEEEIALAHADDLET
jgi:hypothetical protein